MHSSNSASCRRRLRAPSSGRPRTRAVDRGAVMVEAAFIIPILFMLVFGMLTYGTALGQRNSIDNAVRESSRYGSTLPASNVTTWLDNVSALTVSAATGDLDAGTPGRYICVALVGDSKSGMKVVKGDASPVYSSSGNCPGVTCPPSSPCVQVVAERTADLDAVAFKRTITLDSAGVSAYER